MAEDGEGAIGKCPACTALTARAEKAERALIYAQAEATRLRGYRDGLVVINRRLEQENVALRAALGNLRRRHFTLEEDCWYSCPKSGECCDDSQPKDFCNCGADEHNAQIDAALGRHGQCAGTEEGK